MRARYLLGCAALLCNGGTASAQEIFIDQNVRFTLKPARRLSPLVETRSTDRNDRGMLSIRPQSGDAPDHSLALRLQRQSRRFIAAQADIRLDIDRPNDDYSPRSRMRMLSVQDHFALSDRLAATLGFRGMKISNRNANVTIGGSDDRLTAHDWFLPHATLSYRPAPALALSIDYTETMRAYGDTGFTGPLGLSRPDFDALRLSLRPEKSRIASLGGQWANGGMLLSASLYRADIRNRLSFINRGYLPTNIGSASLTGIRMMAQHRVTPHLDMSLRYQHAAVETMTGRSVQERDMTLAMAWTGGAWRIAAQASRTGRAALAATGLQQSPVRAEGSITYAPVQQGRRPWRLAARFTNPGRLVSDDMSGASAMSSLRAVDQARAVMVSAEMGW